MKLFRRNEIAPFLAKIDQDRLRDIQRRYAGSSDRYTKYADVERWLRINIRRAHDLKLDRGKPKQILDLGCGAGFFLFVAKHYGHAGLGLDVDDFAVSNELIGLFGIERVKWRIRALQPLPNFGRQFNLITGFSTAFNRSEGESRGWSADEWSFFLDELNQRLEPYGEIFFEINSGKDGRYFSGEIRELFLRRGGRVNGEFVRFPGKL